jgi:serine/threonine protein kinase
MSAERRPHILDRDHAPTAAAETVDEPQATPAGRDGLPAAFGRYRVIRRLGEGGMGTVYEADDAQLQRRVAVKLPHFAGPADKRDRARRRFLREARSAAAVEHPNVCPIFDVGEHDGRPYVVIAYVDGQSLADRLRTHPDPDGRESARLLGKVAAGLAAVHAHGIVHRDLKPANILVRRKDGEPVLTDFGLAQGPADDESLTADGAIVGTPAYMAPEQADPGLGPVTERSDLYSLGVVLFEMVTGRRPFEGSPTQIIAQVSSRPAPRASSVRPDVDPALDRLIAKATARRPEDRFATADEFATALKTWLDPEHLPATLALPAALNPRRRRRAWLVALALMALVLALGSRAYLAPKNIQRVEEARSMPPGPAPEVAAGTPIKGAIDVKVWRKDRKDVPGVKLSHPAALPLAPGDWLRIEIELNRPVFVYVVWINTEGKAEPLYPWTGPEWASRPKSERRMERLSLPEGDNEIAPLSGGPPGIETLLLLTRDTPLPSDTDMAALFAGLPAQTSAAPGAAAWFENGTLVRHEVDRGPIRLDQARPSDDPVLKAQAMLKGRLKDLFPYTRGVSFANRGD